MSTTRARPDAPARLQPGQPSDLSPGGPADPSASSPAGPSTPRAGRSAGRAPDHLTRRRRRRTLGLAVLVVLLVVLVVLSLALGSRPVPLGVVRDALLDGDRSDDRHLIVLTLRIPRTILAVAVGAALGTAGAVMQALTRNPLAETGILGINAGAAAAVATGIAAFGLTDFSEYVWFALAGTLVTAAGVYALGGAFRGGSDPVRLTLAGAALSVVLGAYTQAILINYPQVFDTFRFWVVGSLQGRTMSIAVPVAVVVAAGLVLALTLSGSLNALALGADAGRALGVSTTRTWIVSGVVVVVLAGVATAAAGPIGFVGLTAPHVARAIVGPDHRRILPYSALVSAVVVLGADVVGRLVAFPGEVATGVVTALVGGPFFVALVRRRRMARL